MDQEQEHEQTVREAKAIVNLAFRNAGPMEYIHAGKMCQTCWGALEYSRITDSEMRDIMKAAVDRVYTLLRLKEEQPENYTILMLYIASFTRNWDEPALDPRVGETVELILSMLPGQSADEILASVGLI